MNNSIAIFSNSIAGNGQAQFKENIITQTLQQANISYTIAPNTSKVASIAWLKSNEAKVKTFIVIGGDGTFNLVINNIEDISSKRFLFIASGTANILANEYDLNPKDILARLAAKSNAIHPAIIKTNNKQTYSLMFTSVGFDADIIATTQRSRNKISSKSIGNLFKGRLAIHNRTFPINKGIFFLQDTNIYFRNNFFSTKRMPV